MARYYFDILDGDKCIKDNTGLELPDADAVRQAVARVILDVARDEMEEDDTRTLQINVRDDSDYVLFTGRLNYSTSWH